MGTHSSVSIPHNVRRTAPPIASRHTESVLASQAILIEFLKHSFVRAPILPGPKCRTEGAPGSSLLSSGMSAWTAMKELGPMVLVCDDLHPQKMILAFKAHSHTLSRHSASTLMIYWTNGTKEMEDV